MELRFDIEKEELPIFMAESDEQFQLLDDGMVQLEREGENPDLLQSLFRAAHTLKGAAGMIGHKRMVALTHALETAMDGLRKNSYPVSTALIDLCLEATDALRNLRGEILTLQPAPVDVDGLVTRFNTFVAAATGAATASLVETKAAAQAAPAASTVTANEAVFKVDAEISPTSIASAARAFQMVLALQDIGTIQSQSPSQAEIDSAKPVQKFSATFQSSQPYEEIYKLLDMVSEINKLTLQQVSGPETLEKAAAPLPALEKPVEAVEAVKAPQAAGPAAAAPSGAAAAPKVALEKTVRTSVERLDNLMNLVGELITDRNRLYQIRNSLDARFRNDDHVETLSETVNHIGRITDQLQKEVMSIRMLPVGNVFSKFPRMVRDLANKFGKKVDLVIEGEDTEMDRSVIEEINDPLIHTLRNAVDHGIERPEVRLAAGKPERARVLLAARYEQGRIIITVEDDGKGIDGEKIKASAVQKGFISEAEAAAMSEDEAVNLVFASGFSTASTLSDISGRGVGLDIVRNNIQRLNGSIMVETWKGQGTRFQLSLPLTLAIVPTLLVRVREMTMAIPLVTVLETLRIVRSDIQTVNARPVIILRKKVLPLVSLANTFELEKEDYSAKQHYVVVVGSGKLQMGLMVDRLLGQEEVVVKSLGSLIGEVHGIASAAILGDGQVILIVDIQDLFRMSGLQHAVTG